MPRAQFLLLLAGMPLLSACSMQAELTPFNATAEAAGVLHANYTSRLAGTSAEVSIRMPDGEQLDGEFRMLGAQTHGFGEIYTATDEQPNAAGQGITLYPGESAGTGLLQGDRGTVMECEFIKLRIGGSGVCQTQAGAIYRLSFSK